MLTNWNEIRLNWPDPHATLALTGRTHTSLLPYLAGITRHLTNC